MRVAVVGGTGTIGKAIVEALEADNDIEEVISISRNSKPVGLDIEDPDSFTNFFQNIGSLDALISATGRVGGFGISLPDLSDDDLQLTIQSKLLGNVNLVRKGLSVVKEDGMFILTAGVLFLTPSEGVSHVALAGGALDGFVRGAALDLTQKVNLVHPPWIKETCIQYGMPHEGLCTASECAQTYLNLLKSGETGQVLQIKGYEV
eukprot:TRINITY_DN1240_c0_g1_i1.p1 TRINITY_DN1240_c0_g1~~TRINITY_DN1240_c0_g1_i1.p1  ORF type:complete len:205 (-),score=40.63 TRINITY_DN1240_c0_g1_i1:44-658(-)